MSITVNELTDFVTTNYVGKFVSLNIEDLSFIARQAEKDSTNAFYDDATNFRFAYIKDNTLLALDESNPVVQRLAATYRIELAKPPLTEFAFDLKFTARPVGPPPMTLMLALRAVGYQGPEVVRLAQGWHVLAHHRASSASIH